MKKLFLVLFLTGCSITSAIKTLQTEQAIVNTLDTSVSTWVHKKNTDCLSLSMSKESPQGKNTVYLECAKPVFDLSEKIADYIDRLRKAHKVEAEVILEVIRGEKPSSVLKNTTAFSSKLLTEVTNLISDLR